MVIEPIDIGQNAAAVLWHLDIPGSIET